jgi:hypothetical protein
VRIQLLPHRDYLLSPHFKQSGYLDQYGKTLHSFLDEILKEPGAPASERTLPRGRPRSDFDYV